MLDMFYCVLALEVTRQYDFHSIIVLHGQYSNYINFVDRVELAFFSHDADLLFPLYRRFS